MYKPYTPKYRPSYRTNYNPPSIKPRGSINYPQPSQLGYPQPSQMGGPEKTSRMNMDWLTKPSKFEVQHPLSPNMRLGIIIVLCILIILLIAAIICFVTIQEDYINTRIYKSKQIDSDDQKIQKDCEI